jgi:transcriptional regulator with XRE-family HTH domain
VGLNGPSIRTRPFEPWELPLLEGFSEALRRHRALAGISQRQLHLATGLALKTIKRLEHAQRRTRPSTIRWIALALAEARGAFCLADEIADEMIQALGGAAAPESHRMTSIERTRSHRVKKLGEDPNADLAPPPRQREELERRYRLALRELRVLRNQQRETAASMEAARQELARCEQWEKQLQRRELALSQRRHAQGAQPG